MSSSDASKKTDRAYLLKSRPATESSVYVDMFTREHGRVLMMVKGARRRTSEFKNSLISFIPFDVTYRGVNDIKTMSKLKWLGEQPLLNGPYLLHAWEANEIIGKMIAREDPYPEIFDAYEKLILLLIDAEKRRVSFLDKFQRKNLHLHINFFDHKKNFINYPELASIDTEVNAALYSFEWLVLDYLGYAPELFEDRDKEPIQSHLPYYMEVESLPRLVHPAIEEEIERSFLPSCNILGRTLVQLREFELNKEDLYAIDDAKRLIQMYLSHILKEELISNEFNQGLDNLLSEVERIIEQNQSHRRELDDKKLQDEAKSVLMQKQSQGNDWFKENQLKYQDINAFNERTEFWMQNILPHQIPNQHPNESEFLHHYNPYLEDPVKQRELQERISYQETHQHRSDARQRGYFEQSYQTPFQGSHPSSHSDQNLQRTPPKQTPWHFGGGHVDLNINERNLKNTPLPNIHDELMMANKQSRYGFYEEAHHLTHQHHGLNQVNPDNLVHPNSREIAPKINDFDGSQFKMVYDENPHLMPHFEGRLGPRVSYQTKEENEILLSEKAQEMLNKEYSKLLVFSEIQEVYGQVVQEELENESKKDILKNDEHADDTQKKNSKDVSEEVSEFERANHENLNELSPIEDAAVNENAHIESSQDETPKRNSQNTASEDNHKNESEAKKTDPHDLDKQDIKIENAQEKSYEVSQDNSHETSETSHKKTQETSQERTQESPRDENQENAQNESIQENSQENKNNISSQNIKSDESQKE